METASLQLPKDLIEAAIKQHVSAAMVAALGDKAKILEAAVAQVLTMKVDSDGKPTNSDYHSSQFIQFAVRDSIQKAVREVLNEEIVKYRDVIKQNIVAQLAKKNSPLLKNLIESMSGALVTAAADKWRLTVAVDDR